MFKDARIKLTAWYLAIIMVISLSFSGVIYFGVNRELTRIENFQRTRIQGIIRGFPVPIEVSSIPDSDAINEARLRIILILGFIDLSILILSGFGGYFLAGQTLDPIAKMVDEQKDFVSNASHELRTPLTSLKTEIEVGLRDKRLSANAARNLLESNLEDVNKMQKLSNYLLALNRYESGREILMSKVDLKTVALKAIGKKNVKTDLKKSSVTGNEDSLVELVSLLLDNAFKYGKNKGVEVRTKSGGVIEVIDHGVGISKADLPHIFDRFYRSDKSRGTDGYGLGLSIAKSIVDFHKGKISVESTVNKGTAFRVIL